MLVPLNRLIAHSQAAHDLRRLIKVEATTGSSGSFVREIACKQRWVLSDRSRVLTKAMYETVDGNMISCAHYERGLLYVWMVVLAGSAEAEKLKCRISFGNAENNANLAALDAAGVEKFKRKIFNGSAEPFTSYIAPVYPIDWTKERIMEDPDCFRVSEWSIAKILNKNIPEEWKELGFDSTFLLSFDIIRSTA
jgi:hypothetical protein